MLAVGQPDRHLSLGRGQFQGLGHQVGIDAMRGTRVDHKGPEHSVRKGKTPVLTAGEARELLDSIVTDTLTGLRDRALIALMTYAFARVGAVLKTRTEDVFIQGRRMRWASTASFRLWWPHYEWPGAAKLLIPFRSISCR